MRLTVHRGTEEIGGSCVEIATETTSILIDAGLPLDNSPANLPGSADHVDAAFVSHCHQDHYGLLDGLADGIPVYIGAVAWRLIQAAQMFRGQPLLNWTTRYLSPWTPVTVGDITVTPYLVDHSAPDAYAFLIEAGEKRIFYSGDFRAHGRKSVLFDRLVERPPQGIDALILEGTMYGRGGQSCPSEAEVEEGMLDILQSEPGMTFLICSGQNIDRLVTAFRAAKRAERQFVIDIYTAWILETMGRASAHTPLMDWPEVRVLAHGAYAARHYGTVKENPEFFGDFRQRIYIEGGPIQASEIYATPDRFLVKGGLRQCMGMVEALEGQTVSTIYSMWPGYMTPQHNPRGAVGYETLRARPGVRFKIVHASGHAEIRDLSRLVHALQPQKVVPIHTEHKELFNKDFENVLTLGDGKNVNLI